MPKFNGVRAVFWFYAAASLQETLNFMFQLPENRRQWIKTAASATAALWCAEAIAAEPNAPKAAAVRLVADPSRQLHRVRVEMDIEGNINVPRNALVSKEKATQVPVSSRSVLDWEERIIGFASDRTAHAAECFYHEARSTGKVGKKEHLVELRPQSQHIRVQREEPRWVVYSPNSYLEGQELDLVKVPASSLAVDALLPSVAVAVGDTYQPDQQVLAKLLSLAAVHSSTVRGEVMSIDDKAAKVHLTGKVEGSVSGVPTTIDLVAKLVFDRELTCCTWLALAVREAREIGKSEPGFDIAGTIRMIRKPLDAPVRLPATPATDMDSIPADRLYTELTSAAVGYAALMDRRWKIMTDVPGASMMRMIQDDTGVAQCDLRPLGKMAAGVQLTLEALVNESRTSMGGRFVEVLQSREEVNEAGLRVLRVTIQGAVENVPVQWIFVHFSDDSGRRLLATMTVSNDHLDTFAGSEEQLTASLQFLPLAEETVDVATNRSQPTDVK